VVNRATPAGVAGARSPPPPHAASISVNAPAKSLVFPEPIATPFVRGSS
jgi:hypothetical protein